MFLRRWQLDEVRIQGGEVEIQVEIARGDTRPIPVLGGRGRVIAEGAK